MSNSPNAWLLRSWMMFIAMLTTWRGPLLACEELQMDRIAQVWGRAKKPACSQLVRTQSGFCGPSRDGCVKGNLACNETHCDKELGNKKPQCSYGDCPLPRVMQCITLANKDIHTCLASQVSWLYPGFSCLSYSFFLPRLLAVCCKPSKRASKLLNAELPELLSTGTSSLPAPPTLPLLGALSVQRYVRQNWSFGHSLGRKITEKKQGPLHYPAKIPWIPYASLSLSPTFFLFLSFFSFFFL